jgi:hypothetical protein
MKNIYILPTDNPSRLVKLKMFGKDKLHLCKVILPIQNEEQYQNIYITSDEEIKEGDWFYNIICLKPEPFKACENGDGYVNCNKYSHYRIDCKKIILSTDQDLIKDGVQAIDDEFLEWFVKNPSCEKVEVDSFIKYNPIVYQIILPKPKQKQKESLIDIMRGDEELGLYDEPKQELLNQYPLTPNECFKQETLEEAAKRIYGSDASKDVEYYAFLNGAKWQAEKMYSEEEVRKSLLDIVLVNPAHISLLKSGYGQFPDTYELTEKGVDYIIEQFKKK